MLFIAASYGNAAELDAKGAIVMNLKSESVLYVQNPNQKVPPASLAKIMTMFVAMDQVKAGRVKLTDKVRVSEYAASKAGSSMGLKKGEVVPLEQLIVGVAVASGNDASIAVAEHIAGSEKAFVKLMNDKAAALGLKNTRFANPHGLPPAQGQWTTANDMLTLSRRYIEEHPEGFLYHGLSAVNHGAVMTTNKNKLLRSCPGVDGLKTGWIRASGFNLVATAQRGDIRLISVILGASTSQLMTEQSQFMIEAGFKTVRSGGTNKVIHQLQERQKAEKAAAETGGKKAKK